jgi:CRISPR-associated protein Csb2
MSEYLCITVRWLDARYHGRTEEGNEPEWPPSPLRLFQAMVAGAKHGYWSESVAGAFQWLEGACDRRPPMVIAPRTRSGQPYTLFVPNNDTDKPADVQRAAKIVRPTILPDDAAVHFLWEISPEERGYAERISRSARHLTALGWGIDLAIADARVIDTAAVIGLIGTQWKPLATDVMARHTMRVPTAGSLTRLEHVYESFLNRLSDGVSRPPLPFNNYNTVAYWPSDAPPARQVAVFKLVDRNNEPDRYNHAQLIHVAAWVRHAAIELCRTNPRLRDLSELVSGHGDRSQSAYRQLSYLPLLSIGHTYTDPDIRRVMIAESGTSSGEAIRRLAPFLHGALLKPESPDIPPRRIVRCDMDGVIARYIKPSCVWASVTPVILPGHDDHKPGKTRKLIEKALVQSGVDQACTFEWSVISHFPKSLPAYKHDRQKRPTGYIRPEHLLNLTAVHLRLEFAEGVEVPGPLALGAGRHCGLGVFANIKTETA